MLQKRTEPCVIERMRELRKSGMGWRRIAAEVGVNSTTVVRYCSDIVLPVRLTGGGIRPSAAQIQRMRALYLSDMPICQIAQETGFSEPTVLKHIRNDAAFAPRRPLMGPPELVQRKISSATISSIRSLRSSGKTYSAIAMEVGVSEQTVKRWASDVAPANGGAGNRLGDDAKEDIQQLSAKGLSCEKIAASLGVSYNTVLKHLNEARSSGLSHSCDGAA